jgi:hypothetical protein
VRDGGQEGACGWCKDKWGLSWQITPRARTAALADPDRAAAPRIRSDDGDEKDRHRRDRSGSVGLTACRRNVTRALPPEVPSARGSGYRTNYIT